LADQGGEPPKKGTASMLLIKRTPRAPIRAQLPLLSFDPGGFS
jgi:hypothetical protein